MPTLPLNSYFLTLSIFGMRKELGSPLFFYSIGQIRLKSINSFTMSVRTDQQVFICFFCLCQLVILHLGEITSREALSPPISSYIGASFNPLEKSRQVMFGKGNHHSAGSFIMAQYMVVERIYVSLWKVVGL